MGRPANELSGLIGPGVRIPPVPPREGSFFDRYTKKSLG